MHIALLQKLHLEGTGNKKHESCTNNPQPNSRIRRMLAVRFWQNLASINNDNLIFYVTFQEYFASGQCKAFVVDKGVFYPAVDLEGTHRSFDRDETMSSIHGYIPVP
jgi:hypothetical protein